MPMSLKLWLSREEMGALESASSSANPTLKLLAGVVERMGGQLNRMAIDEALLADHRMTEEEFGTKVTELQRIQYSGSQNDDEATKQTRVVAGLKLQAILNGVTFRK